MNISAKTPVQNNGGAWERVNGLELLLAKLSPPRLEDGIIARPRLMKLLLEPPGRKLILLAAPAGYGKSILARQYMDAAGLPAVWYRLDEHDNDPKLFLAYLAAGIRRHFPDLGTGNRKSARQIDPTARPHPLVAALTNELVGRVPPNLLIVLDGYHQIAEPRIHQLTQDLLDCLPAGVRMILAGRDLPPLTLARLKAADEVTILGPGELRFTPQECGIFLAKRHPGLPRETIEALEARTAGWPAALKLLADSAPDPALGLSKPDNAEIYDYLAAEILDRQPEDLRRFLMVTSVLDALTPEDCGALLEMDGAAAMLDSLLKRRLIQEEEGILHYHSLFREFLLYRLGGERERWRRRAMEITRRKSDLAGAVEYLLAAGEADRESIGLLQAAGRETLGRGRWLTVQRWLARLPERQKRDHPWLGFLQAGVKVYQGRLEEAEAWLADAYAGFAALQDELGRGECLLLRARILRLRGLYHESLENLKEAERSLGEGSELVRRFGLPLEKSLLLIVLGKLREAEVAIGEALSAAEKENQNDVAAHFLEWLGNLNYLLGDYPKALQIYQEAAEISPARSLPGYYSQDFIAAIYAEWGELETALRLAERNAESKERLGPVESLPSVYYQLASIHIDRGELGRAEECCRKALALLAENGGEHFYLILIRLILARCLCLQGRLTEAREAEEEVLRATCLQPGLLSAIAMVVEAGILAAGGESEEAGRMLREAAAALEGIGFQQALAHCYAALAGVDSLLGDRAAADEYARKALELSAKRNFLQSFVTFFPQFQAVLRFGLETGVEISFVQRILTRLGDRAADLMRELAGHPDPKVRSRLIAPLAQSGAPWAEALLRMLKVEGGPERRVERPAGEARSGGEAEQAGPLRIEALGPLRIFWGRKELTACPWRSVKARDLLVYLAHRGEPITQDRLIEDLWPDAFRENSTDNFHTTLYRLRRVLEREAAGGLVRYAGRRCHLAPDSCLLDRRLFEELVLPELSPDPLTEEGARRLERALALYRGDYLEDLDYPWVVPDREYLKRLHLEAGLKLARHYLERKEHARAIVRLARLFEADPLGEEVCRLLMLAYNEAGDRAAARKQYQILQENLERELGIAPSEETRRLFRRLGGAKEGSPSFGAGDKE